MLSVMLDAHSEVLCGPELALFSHPFFWTQEGREWRERLQSYLGQDDQATRSPAWTLAEGVCPYTDIVYTNTLPWYGLSVSERVQVRWHGPLPWAEQPRWSPHSSHPWAW